MSEQEWAAIVYGRTYHLDFRFITLPDNFDSQDAQWALSYITATTQQARNLAGSPRWSLFKNDAYCVVGVTCMVRDLIKPASSDLLSITKDDQGRPLYVFVGYVTQLKQQKKLTNFPPYGENCLDDFRDLYQEIAQVWLVKNYEEDKIKTSLSDYQRFSWKKSEILPDKQQIKFLNHYLKSPEQTHLWSSLPQQNSLLWQFSARCSLATATCLNINGKALSNSPFLNQSCSQVEQFQIKPRLAAVSLDNSISLDSSKTNSSPGLPLSQQISHRAKQDLDLTLHQAAKLATASQELINSFSNSANQSEPNAGIEANIANDAIDEAESFGFKTKKSSPSNNQDWF